MTGTVTMFPSNERQFLILKRKIVWIPFQYSSKTGRHRMERMLNDWESYLHCQSWSVLCHSMSCLTQFRVSNTSTEDEREGGRFFGITTEMEI